MVSAHHPSRYLPQALNRAVSKHQNLVSNNVRVKLASFAAVFRLVPLHKPFVGRDEPKNGCEGG